MPTYTIDGVKYKSDAPLSDDELEELSGGVVAPTKKQPEGDYSVEAARKGVAGGVGTLAGISAYLSAAFGGRATGASEAFEQTRESVRQPIMEMLGSTGIQPKDLQQKIIATGIETATDPISYMLPGGGAIQRLGVVGRGMFRPIEAMVSGSGAEMGGTAGEYVGQKIGGETGARVGRIAGALTGGAGGAAVAGGTPRTIAVAKNIGVALAPKVRNAWRGISGKTPIDEVERQANRHIENIFVAAASSDPNFAKVLEDAATAQAATGIKLPLSSVLADNAVINTYIEGIASRDPSFRNQYFSQFNAAKDALHIKSSKLFGKPSAANEVLGKTIKDMDTSKAVSRRISDIQNKISKSSAGIEKIDPAEFGNEIIGITEEAKKSAIKASQPFYQDAFSIAKTKGVVLPKESVEDIYGYVVNEKTGDVFKTFPSIYGKVSSKFKPSAPSTVIGANALAQRDAGFSAATVEDLDSLKREVNLQLRKTTNESEIRLLNELKNKVSRNIEKLDPDFVSAYKTADQIYLKNVGLPFNEQTINMIGRAKFDENVVPLLTKNKSTLSQFIDATGDAGKDLAEKAFVSDLEKFAVKDGVLNPTRARAWLKNKDNALSLLPDVKDRVTAISNNVQDLMNQKSALNDRFIKSAESRILKLEGKSAQEIVNSMYGSRNFTDKFMSQHGANKDNLNAIRSFMLDDILKSGKPIEMLNDRTKASTFDRVFGSTYSDKIKQLSVIADRITHDPSAVSPNISSIPKTRIEEMVGAPPEMIISRITNPVMSNFYAATSLISRFMARKTSEAIDRDMKQILLDPEKASLLLKNLQPRIDKVDYVKMSKDVAELSKKTGLNFTKMLLQDARAGALRSTRGMDVEQQQQYEEEQP